MKTWIKLYTKINRDPDMGTLTWAERGIWSAVLALAGEIDDQDEDGPTGRIDTAPRIAWHLRMLASDLDVALSAFEKRGMIEEDEDGIVMLPAFRKRQKRAPSSQPERVAERVQRHRAKAKRGCNESVTTLKRGVTPSDSETEKIQKREEPEPDNDGGAKPAFGLVIDAWKATGSIVSKYTGDLLGEMCDEYAGIQGIPGDQWVVAAIEAGAKSSTGPPSINYIDAICKRWVRDGFESPYKGNARASPADADAELDAWAARVDGEE